MDFNFYGSIFNNLILGRTYDGNLRVVLIKALVELCYLFGRSYFCQTRSLDGGFARRWEGGVAGLDAIATANHSQTQQ